MSLIKILGCSGSIGEHGYTTSLLINNDTLIDAGSGLLNQSIASLKKINQIYVTHSHLDHVLGIPLMADAVGSSRVKPIEVLGHTDTIAILKKHIFNHKIWPDFSQLPTKIKPFIKYKLIKHLSTHKLSNITITPFLVNHTVTCFGYRVSSKTGSVIFSGDTGPSKNLIDMINTTPNCKAVIIDVSFQNSRTKLASESKHFTPKQLIAELQKIKVNQNIFITHQKPGDEQKIIAEFKTHNTPHQLNLLKRNQVINF
jgi:ribonuclease BN (tRNA processing enzyme)